MTEFLEQLRNALAGRYRIEREIGQGGMATVYLAHDLKHDRRVAIKVLRPELTAALGPERFLREIRIAAQLQHPHILSLIDSGTLPGAGTGTDGRPYYVMPFVEGESLRERLSRDGALPVADATRILRDVADGLAYAHQKGVVHRDIKPDNVMISGRHALVMDFGVAKAVREAAGNLTTTGLAVGTPAYMAPEQAAAEPEIDHRADLYAFGILAYEVLTGQPPFTGRSAQAILSAHITQAPEALTSRFPPCPPALAQAVMKCLEKQPTDRWQSADELLSRLEAIATPSGGMTAADTAVRSAPETSPRRWAWAAVAALLCLGVVGWYWGSRQGSQVRWAKEQAIPLIQRLANDGQWDSAFVIARKAEALIPRDSTLTSLWSSFSRKVVIRSDPEGARVAIRDYSATDAAWQSLGVTPLDSIWFPFGFHRLRIEKQGLPPFDGATFSWTVRTEPYRLFSGTELPEGMSWVPAGAFEINMPGLDHLPAIDLGDFLIDRFEVTNRAFKQFMESGGYRNPDLWEFPFVKDGKTLSWDAAIAEFKDRTGRPGPATWEAGDYPTGQDDYPVTGVSWYEAAAYAKFAGKALPTIYHWNRAALLWAASWIIPKSNFSGQGAAPVGRYQGIGPYGTFDMAGNAREWCLNQSGTQRFILGGGWNDQQYQFNDAYAQPPFDRSATNGIRLVKYLSADSNLSVASRTIDRPVRDFTAERPVSDQVFAIYRRMYDYDHTPLKAVIAATDSSSSDWVRQRIEFDAAYGGERMAAYLFLPRSGKPPYQTVVYFPGSNAIHQRTREPLETGSFDFILKSGRAVLYPVYKSTYERGDCLDSDYPNESNFYKEHVIAWAKDLRRSVDYAETRPEMDPARLGYYGVSWGAELGGLMPAIEPRFKVVVLYVAGLSMQRSQPEVEPLNFLPRIQIPVLMLNGRFDHFFPLETSQVPMFNLLGTPAGQKRHVVADGGHFVPRTLLITEILSWLDKYLGPVG